GARGRTASEAKARTRLRERLRTAGTPEFIGPAAERVMFDDLAERYLTDYRVNRKRSLRDATRAVVHLRSVFGDDRALDVTADRIAQYAEARLAEGKRPATVNRELAALRRMFSLAIKCGMLRHHPHIQLLAEENAREGFLEPADFAALRGHLSPWLADAATFA